jgi:hypothetical protein
MHRFNEHSEIRNRDKFPIANPVPIVIRTYQRNETLRIALEYWRKVRGIESALLVISHDHFNDDIFRVADEMIDFCQYKHVVHPFSAAIHSNRWPGQDVRIPSNMTV